MMTSNASDTPTPSPTKSRGILCSKCERLNPHGLENCDRCGEDLFYSCHRCGERNQKVFNRCRKCGRLGVKTWVNHLSERSSGWGMLSPLTLLTVFVAILLVFVVVWSVQNVAALRLW